MTLSQGQGLASAISLLPLADGEDPKGHSLQATSRLL